MRTHSRAGWSGSVGLLILLTASASGAQSSDRSAGALPPPGDAAPSPTERNAEAEPPAPGAVPTGDARTDAKSAVEVIVAGTKVARTAGSAHVIKSRQLERFEYDDPHAVLAAVPGVYSRGEDGVGLRPNIGVRGVNPDRSKKLTLMEDGVLFAPAPYSAPAAYYFPIITRMSSVRVIKGPAAISYGPHTVGGAIDLVTRPIPANPSGAIDIAGGMYGYNKLHGYFGASNEKTGYLIEGIHLGTEGFKELPNGADTGFVRNEWMFKGSYEPDPTAETKNEFRLKLTYSDEVSNETYLGLSEADFRDNPNRRYPASQLDQMRNHRTSIAVSHFFAPTPKLSITTTVYRNDFARVWRKANRLGGAALFDVLRNPTDARNAVYYSVLTGQSDSSTAGETLFVGPNDRNFAAHGIESRVRWDTTTGPVAHRLEYAMRLHYDRADRRHSENGFKVLGGQLVPDGGPTLVTAFNAAWTEALALHAVDAVTWKSITLTPGFRVEAMRSAFVDRAAGTETRRLAQVFLPGAGAFVAATEELGFLAGVYRGFSPPEPGSPSSVKPELSVNYEAGARFASKRARFEVIGFDNEYSNITDICTLSSGCVEANLDRQYDGGRARIYGFEAFAEAEVPAGEWRFPLTVAYTLTRSEFLSSFRSDDPIFGNVQRGDEMPYVPRHQATVLAGIEGHDAALNGSATYVAAMREEAGSEPLASSLSTDRQFVIDLAGSYRIYGPVVLYANLRNLLDERAIVSRRPYGARPNAPRWLQVGVKVAF